jgi:catechol 2,3-dioxygenase-like lactoylglutathione lyase family enzyme
MAEQTPARRPAFQVTSVTIGAPDPSKLAVFYAELLGWTITADDPALPGDPPEAGWAQLRAPAGQAGPTLNFEYEAQFARPAWPARPGEPVATEHLDIAVTSLDEGVAWAVAAGATLAEFQPQEDVRVLFDPAGHPFCLYVP